MMVILDGLLLQDKRMHTSLKYIIDHNLKADRKIEGVKLINFIANNAKTNLFKRRDP